MILRTTVCIPVYITPIIVSMSEKRSGASCISYFAPTLPMKRLGPSRVCCCLLAGLVSPSGRHDQGVRKFRRRLMYKVDGRQVVAILRVPVTQVPDPKVRFAISDQGKSVAMRMNHK